MNRFRLENIDIPDFGLEEAYKKLNEPKFRNYIYDFKNSVEYTGYIDVYETVIDDLIDKIKDLQKRSKNK